MTRELVLNGRLPQFAEYGDHIARYGKGFSQMLNIASTIDPISIATLDMKSPRMNKDFSLPHLNQTLQENPID